ncbi:MAG: hypothetical protein WAV31_01200 [Candidatus Moraniibacteriota bacterium]
MFENDNLIFLFKLFSFIKEDQITQIKIRSWRNGKSGAIELI